MDPSAQLALELIAGTNAAKKFIADKVPIWARNMISDDMISSLVRVVVEAVDEVRPETVYETPPPTTIREA